MGVLLDEMRFMNRRIITAGGYEKSLLPREARRAPKWDAPGFKNWGASLGLACVYINIYIYIYIYIYIQVGSATDRRALGLSIGAHLT